MKKNEVQKGIPGVDLEVLRNVSTHIDESNLSKKKRRNSQIVSTINRTQEDEKENHLTRDLIPFPVPESLRFPLAPFRSSIS